MSFQRLRDWMRSARADAALLTDPTSISYLTGFHANPHERLMALALSAQRAVLLVPWLERENAIARATGVEVLAWQDGEDPFRPLREALGDHRRLAVEKDHLTVSRWEALDAVGVIDAGPILGEMRAVKGPAEIERLRQAAAFTDEVTDAVFGVLRAGMSEIEVAALVDGRIAATGSQQAFATLVQSGPNSALPHLPPGSRRLAAGDLVLLDFGARHQGYNGDTTRMGVVGEPDDRQREVHQAVLDAHDRAIEAIREGSTCGAVDAAARLSIERAGYGEYFIHRTGHGLGLDSHEPPNLEPGSARRLEAGNVVTVEPGIYMPGWGGVRIEDDVVVEEDGALLLTGADRGLRVIPS